MPSTKTKRKPKYTTVREASGAKTLLRDGSQYGRDYNTATERGKYFKTYAASSLGKRAEKKAKKK